MTRIGRDSTNASAIPTNGLSLAMGYVNGGYAWSTADWRRFSSAGIALERIDVLGNVPGQAGILDVELHDATPGQSPGWVNEHHRLCGANAYAVIYCNRCTLSPVFNAMNAAGLKVGKDFHLWIATLDGTKSVPDMTGVVAVQAYGSAQTGHDYDESIIYDDNWHRTVALKRKSYLVIDSALHTRIMHSGDVLP